MMHSVVGYSTKIIRMESGERFPLMVSRATGLPDAQVCSYSTAHHRKGSINSAKREIDAICLLHEWLDKHDIDLNQRVQGGRLFDPQEIEMLSEALRASKKPPRIVSGKSVARIVHADTHTTRMGWAFDYIRWRTAPIIARASSPAHAINLRSRLTETEDQIKSLCSSGTQTQKDALTDEQRAFLLQVCRPDDPRNPFRPHTRHRNFAVVLMLDELGLREGEPLVLKGVEDVFLHGSDTRIVITPRPNDPDEKRRKPPLVKTAGRTLMLSKLLASVLDAYGTRHRGKAPGAKKVPYFFMGTRGGAAMSLDSIYDIFEVLRDAFPAELPSNLSPHIMRHTWNARFRRRAKELGWEDAFRDVVNNYLMGWAKNSKQSSRYGHSEIVREAQRMLIHLQAQIEGVA